MTTDVSEPLLQAESLTLFCTSKLPDDLGDLASHIEQPSKQRDTDPPPAKHVGRKTSLLLDPVRIPIEHVVRDIDSALGGHQEKDEFSSRRQLRSAVCYAGTRIQHSIRRVSIRDPCYRPTDFLYVYLWAVTDLIAFYTLEVFVYLIA